MSPDFEGPATGLPVVRDESPPAGLPVVVIGGYLGAGKTTLINHLLRQAAGRRLAVLVNDFGNVNIDADLVAGAALEAGHASPAMGATSSVLALSGGCLCCSFGDDLVGTLQALQQRRPAPDAVLIELSGVALPGSVVRTARLALGVHVVGTWVLADAEQVQRQAGDRYVGGTVQHQLQEADWVLLTKTDRVDAATSASAQAWLQQLAPQAHHLACAAQDLPLEQVLGWRPDTGGRAGEGVKADESTGGRFAAAPAHSLRGAAQAHASLFVSATLDLPSGTRLQALGAALAQPSAGVLRAKGLLADAQGRVQLLQLAGPRWAVTAPPLQQHFTPAGRLVVIGLRGQMAPATLQAMIAGCGLAADAAGAGTPCAVPH